MDRGTRRRRATSGAVAPGSHRARVLLYFLVSILLAPRITAQHEASLGLQRDAEFGGGLRTRNQALLADPAAALAAARLAREAGERDRSVWLLEEVVARHPVVADHAALGLAEILDRDGHHASAIAVLRRILREYPASPLAPELNDVLGRALASEGDAAAAQAAWRAALDSARDEDLRAGILLSIGESEQRQGRRGDAATSYKLIWYAHPLSESAEAAERRLEALESSLPAPVRKAEDWRRRGDRLSGRGRNELALIAYEEALTVGLEGASERKTRIKRAHALFRLRRYEEATRAFEELGAGGQMPIWHARSLARAGAVPEAIAALEALGAETRSARSRRARYLAGMLLEGRGFETRAQQHFRALAGDEFGAGWAAAANWRLAWAAYRAGRSPEAEGYFERLIEIQRGEPLEQLRPRYWHARALEARKPVVAQAEFASIAREFPLSYYGWRALGRLGEGGGARGAVKPPPRGRSRLAPVDLRRIRILLEAGLLEAARDEVERLSRRARSLSERLELAQLASDAGDFHRAQRLVVDAYSEKLARGPLPHYEELWWYAWPAAYSSSVRGAARMSEAVEPALLYAVMREESNFRKDIVSPAGARGLLQIMTATGSKLAEGANLDGFAPDDLFDPAINIQLGSAYLSQLYARFEGRRSASIASYNAGPEVVSEWLALGPLEDDEWVESIPYDQTRKYVKRVLSSLHAYRILY